MQMAGAGALTPFGAADLDAAQVSAPPKEGPDTPKIALGMPDAGAGSGPPRIKQLGVNWVLGGGPGQLPWTEEVLTKTMEPWKATGITVGNLMINLSSDILYGREGNKRDDDAEKVKQSIVAAGKVGLPVVEYNFYAHRAMEGYFEEIDTERGNSGWTGFDYELVQTADRQYQARPEEKGMKFKDLPPLPNEGAHNLDEMWKNIAWFLKAVIPTAEKAGVRLALHPNDPPAPVSRGSQQIMGTVAGWKKLISIVNSPANGITFDCGVTREMGEDPVEVCRWFASRDRINHVHFRNVLVIKPYERYREVWIDEGLNNMFAVMKELVKNKYRHEIYPEHPRRLDYDAERGRIGGYPGGGGYAAYAYNVGYARAMLQAAMS
jgi:mannonate dehydratase